ncbi:DUF6436 domain-containing protein [Ectopseudomonas guguanensis]|jgi:hypothetical protein|uniref:DUF6436 domain-containing protein n=1 Tax=Ectopseudomonas guguanensis TaxID=1198456 RepID=A0A1H0TIM9_9GAMM|nr:MULTISPECIES: DUF6436 domain-containing protein [Pseudomonas]MDR8015024.1 DUF6436 domain-containing protein [Pseudomonas guguanensis]MPT17604.1 thiol-disulfide isomerase [Pseudomonas sp.]WJH59128.1 thiol-disulfide isomerase [Pseudomonas guguanensis]SDP53897.1 hypothetical protein SAMN05216213_104180 [Pseudomonas guguanensis]
MPRFSRKTLFAALLALVWLGGMLLAFWWFEARYLRPFDERAAVFAGADLRLPDALAGPGAIRLVHFWDPACPCNVGNQQHLAELIERYAPKGVQFHVLQKAGSQGRLPAALAALQPIDELPGSANLPASPAVAIWDGQGQLAYFGPYSEGLTCSSSNSFIEPILEALAEGRKVDASNTLAVGCFCDWQ